MGSAEVLPVTREHIEQLAKSMRPEDMEEVLASGGFDPLDALERSVAVSELVRTAVFDGEVAAIWGVMPGAPPVTALGGSAVGIPWALTGRAVNRRPKAFLRYSRLAVDEMLEHYELLAQFVDGRYDAALRWAAWLGFQVLPPVPFGVAGLPFHPIIMRRRDP